MSSTLAAALSKSGLLAGSWIAPVASWNGWIAVATLLVLAGALFKTMLTRYFGDVARYIKESPRNIKIRQTARERGIGLVESLHRAGEYRRIVIVGHSLGSILAHDIIAFAWARFSHDLLLPKDSPLLAIVRNCEQKGLALLQACGEHGIPNPGFSRDTKGCQCSPKRAVPDAAFENALSEYRLSQRTLSEALATTGAPGADGKRQAAWLVSDLVTLGSPLSHAEFLMARSACEFSAMVRSREILRSPPVYELGDGNKSFLFSPSKVAGVYKFHHAAAMASVRWTNLYDLTGPLRFLSGDVISGPLSPIFGQYPR